MKQSKFTFNAFLIVVIIFSAFALFFTVKLFHLADRTAVNSFHRIEQSEFAVKYSSLEPDGIYKGSENSNTLLLKGTFGYDWGAVIEGDTLFINEYSKSNLGFTVSDVVKIDLNNATKKVVCKNAVLRGKNLSGELVILYNYIMPSNFVKTNPFSKLYAMNDFSAVCSPSGSKIIFLSPKTLEIVYSKKAGIAKDFDEKYINKTLEEVKGQ